MGSGAPGNRTPLLIMKMLNKKNLIKLILIYWVVFFLINILFHPWHYIDVSYQLRYEWDEIFNWAIGIPLAVIVIYKIVEWGNKK